MRSRSFFSLGEVAVKVAIFFDGKNFHVGWKDRAGGVELDYGRLATWVVEQVGGSALWGANYYTGIETSGPAAAAQAGFTAFLDRLEEQPGYFVKRFPRKTDVFRCEVCSAENRFTREKEVDTTMVADMLRLAAVDGFDILVLVSGDADYAPAVEGVRTLGKKVYVATWGGRGLAPRLRRSAFDHIDLTKGLDSFTAQPTWASQTPTDVLLSDELRSGVEAAFLQELERAEAQFGAGYVGTHYFLTKWRSTILDASPDVRSRILDRLKADGRVEQYSAPNGDSALRIGTAPVDSDAPTVKPST